MHWFFRKLFHRPVQVEIVNLSSTLTTHELLTAFNETESWCEQHIKRSMWDWKPHRVNFGKWSHLKLYYIVLFYDEGDALAYKLTFNVGCPSLKYL